MRFRRRTVSTASASVVPAMYRAEKSWTTCFGTAGSRRTIVLSSSVTAAGVVRVAHQALAGCADERNRLGEEHAHRVAQRECLLVDRALRLHLAERGRGELDRGVERLLREVLRLHFLGLLALLLHHLLERAHELLGVAPERESKAAAAFHRSQASGPL